jgi:hypothetical protein
MDGLKIHRDGRTPNQLIIQSATKCIFLITILSYCFVSFIKSIDGLSQALQPGPHCVTFIKKIGIGTSYDRQ